MYCQKGTFLKYRKGNDFLSNLLLQRASHYEYQSLPGKKIHCRWWSRDQGSNAWWISYNFLELLCTSFSKNRTDFHSENLYLLSVQSTSEEENLLLPCIKLTWFHVLAKRTPDSPTKASSILSTSERHVHHPVCLLH